jgi:hypothetical protein
MTTLGQAPGGAVFIGALVEAIKDFSLLYAGTPDDRARQHLETFISAIEPSITKAVGAKTAPKLLDALRGAVMGRKHELEARSIGCG